jgi:hypothetical protein
VIAQEDLDRRSTCKGALRFMMVSSRIILAAGLLIAAWLLHVMLCDWSLTPRDRPPFERLLWTIHESPPDPTTGRTTGRYFAAPEAVTYSEAWTWGVAMPVIMMSVAGSLLPPIRRQRRIDAGRCPRCGYDLRFDFARGCTECGWRMATGMRP